MSRIDKSTIITNVTAALNAERTSPLREREVRTILDAFLDEIGAQVASGNTVALLGFGAFEPRERQARSGVNPQTHERITIAGGKSVGFRVGEGLRSQVGGRTRTRKPASA